MDESERIVRNSEWAIGIYEGASPLTVAPSARVRNPVVAPSDATDIETATVADPFMVWNDDGWFMFFEVLPAHSNLGQIAVARSQDGLVWTYDRVVLKAGGWRAWTGCGICDLPGAVPQAPVGHYKLSVRASTPSRLA